MKQSDKILSRGSLLGFLVLLGSFFQAAATSLPFDVELSGSANVPTVTVTNRGVLTITSMELTIGDFDKHFQYAGARRDKVTYTFSGGLGPNESESIPVDVDNDPDEDTVEDYRRVLFNNDGDGAKPNSTVTVFGPGGLEDSLEMPDGPADNTTYLFKSESRSRNLEIRSATEVDRAGAVPILVKKGNLTIKRVTGDVNHSLEDAQTKFTVLDGETIEITVPNQVYRDVRGVDITTSVGGDEAKIRELAEERFVASGISVNDVPQTGDPVLVRFKISDKTTVDVKWQHEYALSIGRDFDDTESLEQDAEGNPWAGPLTSDAAGNPDPPVKKHWIRKGETFIAKVDSQVLDFSRPGLNIRYIPVGYRAYGPPNTKTRANDPDQETGDRSTREAARMADSNPLSEVRAKNVLEVSDETDNPFEARQDNSEVQQVPEFTMYGPAGIEYVWQIQFGIAVNVDDLSRSALPRIFNRTDNTVSEGEGIFWFNPDDNIVVAAPANVAGPNSLGLNGWINGDGYFFSSSGDIKTDTGELTLGGPAQNAQGQDVAVWRESLTENDILYRGLEIPKLQRAGRVLWRYGQQAIAVQVEIGQYVFQGDPEQRADTFITEPEEISIIAVSGQNPNAAEMAIWDPEAAKLYPVVPGLFRAKWKPTPTSPDTVNVVVTVVPPQPAHYPHIADSPPVALDPDADDAFTFKEIKYTENGAQVDADKQFTSSTPGLSVLLFSELQPVGRGQTREFLRVRVVETVRWNENLPSIGDAIIGQKITDDLDRAEIGTGYVRNPLGTVRFNPFVYDEGKLTGLAASSIYDMELLRSDLAIKDVIRPENLPGPVIPVNLHPGALADELLTVVWYDDPSENDGLMWPYRARVYKPRWPTTPGEGAGRIVIASQFGSESVDEQGEDQLVVEVSGDFPRETTFNPSRLQQVQIYSQDDPDSAGYNANEEHALMAGSLRFAQVSPRPPAAYALRAGDLNSYNENSLDGADQDPATYTSHPRVLVQYFDTADAEFKMRVYSIEKEDPALLGATGIRNYTFADQNLVTPDGNGNVNAGPVRLNEESKVVMEAAEPVIPFYPLGVAIGASPCAETFGTNLKGPQLNGQQTYWEDHKGTSWAVAGGEDAWFTVSFYYPMAPDFWWPPNQPGLVREFDDGSRLALFPRTGDCVSFLPTDIDQLLGLSDSSAPGISAQAANLPTKILYKSDWPENPPVLKAGETLTFSGGEFRADNPTRKIPGEDNELKTVETPGLPGVLAFATAEVVFDSLNPAAQNSFWESSWTARVIQGLEVRRVVLSIDDFPPELQPASGRVRVSQGKYIFNDLPASLQKRMRYNPLSQSIDPSTGLRVTGKLEISGLVNDKDIGDPTLTAAPPAVYILEPNILTEEERDLLQDLDNDDGTPWDTAVNALYEVSRNPSQIQASNGQPLKGFLAGLDREIIRNGVTGLPLLEPIEPGSDVMVPQRNDTVPEPLRAFGVGLALIPNAGFLDPQGVIPDPSGGPGTPFPEVSWVTVAENNDPSLGGSPVTLHVIQVSQKDRYRGAIKTVESDNVFDENLGLRHTGDFGANADELFFEWWYRPDDGSLNVPPPDMIPPGDPNPWLLFPDPTGERGRGRYSITLKGNPNAPEALLADTWWFVRYRHENDNVDDTDWQVPQLNGDDEVNFTWAGAGNSDPFNDFDNDGFLDFRAQLAQGWIKRVLDAVNPYEARIRDFEGDNPATQSSMIVQFGPRFEGPVALNPAKNVIENVGLIELYETVLKRGRDLSIDLSRPVATPAIFNALQLASTRISDFYTILGNEAYTDAVDPTIGFGSNSVEYGSHAPAVFAFQNQVSSLIEEELGLLRGLDDFFARPVYNRMFWNFTKGEGEAAYAVNYNISDITADGFINEDDAMKQFPMGHGDAWGHYLTALRNQYELLNHPFFNWVSRSEFYNLQDIVIKVDFLDERKFAQTAAAKAKAGSEIVDLTYREKYVEDPTAQWQGYTDTLPDRAWGVQGWARRAGQGAYFDWVTSNALLPAEHPNETLEGIQKVDRTTNSDIAVISANMNRIQRTFDRANDGQNPLGLAGNVVPFDINPAKLDRFAFDGTTHFEQVLQRSLDALNNTVAIWNNANESRNRLRKIANSEEGFRNSTFQQDLSYRNRLIKIFGRPYEGTIGSGRLYPPGYDGPDTMLYMYVDVRNIDNTTVPLPTTSFASFDNDGDLQPGGDVYKAFVDGQGKGRTGRATLADIMSVDEGFRELFSPTFAPDSNGVTSARAQSGLYAVNYTDLLDPKVPLENLTQLFPITAAGYTFQAPDAWGSRVATGELQIVINKMIQQEAQIARAIGAWDGLSGDIVRTLRLLNAKLDKSANITLKNEIFSRVKLGIEDALKVIRTTKKILDETGTQVNFTVEAAVDAIPENLPTGGLAFSPGDALSAVRGGLGTSKVALSAGIGAGEVTLLIAELIAEISLDIAENELNLFEAREEGAIDKKEMLKALEDLVGDEPIRRIEIFKEIEALRLLSDQYRALLDEGSRLIDERAAFNKRVAAQTQRNRYQDMTFRVSRNHALENYRAMFDLASQYAYLAAKAYDYETNLDPSDPGSPAAIYNEIVKARTVGLMQGGQPRFGAGGLAESLAWLKTNFEAQKGQLGFNNPQVETGKISLRTEAFRILPEGDQPGGEPEFPSAGADSDGVWQQVLSGARVDDLWMIPEFRYFCRPFAAEADGAGDHVEQPGIVLRFGTEVMAGRNFFGKALSGNDHAYDPSLFVTKVRAAGVWFSNYQSENVLTELAEAPRVYLVPVGTDVFRVPSGDNPNQLRAWNVLDQKIPVPLPSLTADLDRSDYIPLLDSLNGRMGEPRRFSSFRAYHDGTTEIDDSQLVFDNRLIGRSVWNTEWVLIIPGATLNADPGTGLDRFIEQVKDIKLVFKSYSYSGG